MDDLDQQNFPDDDNQEKNKFQTKQIYAKISPISAAFLGLFGSFFLYQILGGGLHLIILGGDTSEASANSIRLLTMAGQLLFILLPALILTKMVYEDVSEIIRVRIPSLREILLFSLGIVVLTPLLQYYLYIQNHFLVQWAEVSPVMEQVKFFFDSLNELVEAAYTNLLRADNLFEGILIVFVVAVVPAVTEEVLFRGYIQRSFEFRMKPFWAALVTAVFFGLFHFNFYGLLPLIALGLYFGFAAYISNSIIVPIILHFLNNFTAIMLFFIIGDDELIKSSPAVDPHIGSSVFMFFIFLVLFLGILTVIKKYYIENRHF
jgi:uncharacterized protein